MKTSTLVLTFAAFFSGGMALANEGGDKADKFQELDTDKDGRLSREEAQKSERMSQKFEKMDANQDGYVTSEEKSAAKAQWKADRPKPRSE